MEDKKGIVQTQTVSEPARGVAGHGISPEASGISPATVATLRRYMQIRDEILQLEREKNMLKESLVMDLDRKFQKNLPLLIDGKQIVVKHEYKRNVHYREPLLRERLGERYVQILDLDSTKIRQNCELVRRLLAPILEKVGKPTAERVKAAVASGAVSMEEFRDAYRVTKTPYIAVCYPGQTAPSAADDAPF